MVYYLAECSRLPVFRLGSVLCARRSVLLDWIAGQEGRVFEDGTCFTQDATVTCAKRERPLKNQIQR